MKPLILLSLLAVSLALPARTRSMDACVQECGYEDEPTLDATALAAPKLLSGADFSVAPKVAIGGYMARFTIATHYGPLTADSAQLLAIRVAEIPAIDTLEKASHTGAFGHALAARSEKTGMAIVHVIAHPVDSITGLPAGVARYFKKQIDTWTGRAQSASDRSSRIFENKGDPFHAPPGPMTAGRDAPDDRLSLPDDDADAAAEPNKKHTWYGRTESEATRETKRYLKYSQARREIAKYLGIDPNTNNPYIGERLDSLAWAATGGNFSAGAAIGEIAGTAATVITDSSRVDEYVLTHDPEQVRERNEKNLLSVCSDEFGVRQFLRRGGFTDTLRTALTDSLLKLKPSAGCNELLELGATTHGEVEARYLVNALSMLLHHSPATTGGKLIVANAALVYLAPDGKLLLPLPVDYLTWNIDLNDFFDRPEFANANKTVLIGGETSELLQRKLTERSWSLVLRAPYDGAPIYPTGGFSWQSESSTMPLSTGKTP